MFTVGATTPSFYFIYLGMGTDIFESLKSLVNELKICIQCVFLSIIENVPLYVQTLLILTNQ